MRSLPLVATLLSSCLSLFGCGSTPRTVTSPEASTTTAVHGPDVENEPAQDPQVAVVSEVVEVAEVAEVAEVVESVCPDYDFRAMRPCGEACVADGESCRPPETDCERVLPQVGADRRIAFRGGDPCGVIDRSCAYDPGAKKCVAFVAVTECTDNPNELNVQCGHPDQPVLACEDAENDTHWECQGPVQYCGGAAPHPSIFNVYRGWVGVANVDTRGCPREIRIGSRCRVRGTRCTLSCLSGAECRGGRWRAFEIPPRPSAPPRR